MTLEDIRTLVGPRGGSFAAHPYTTGAVRAVHVPPSGSSHPALDWSLQMGEFAFEIITLAPLISSISTTGTSTQADDQESVSVAVVGLIDKYNPLAGVVSFSFNPASSTWDAPVKCSGTLGFYVTLKDVEEAKRRIRIVADGKDTSFCVAAAGGGVSVTLDMPPAVQSEAEGSDANEDAPYVVQLSVK